MLIVSHIYRQPFFRLCSSFRRRMSMTSLDPVQSTSLDPIQSTSLDPVQSIYLDPVQSTYLNEPCILVDENDRPIGSLSKRDAHHKSTAALHRAFSVFAFTAETKLILQKRSSTKITFPSAWTNACCSHPLYTQSEMDAHHNVGVRRAAVRKLEHELGLNTVKIEDLTLVGRFLYQADYNGEWAENELDYVLILPNCPVESVKPNTEEVEMIRAMDIISPWFRMLYNAGWISKWWRNLKDLDRVADLQTIHRLNG